VKTCPACGREYPEGAVYCALCGGELVASPEKDEGAEATAGEPGVEASPPSPENAARRAAPVKLWVALAVGVVFVGAVVVLAGVAPAVAKAQATRRAARREGECREHLVRLGVALGMYVSDYGGHFPLKENWCDGLMPYVKDTGAFRCPDGAYAYNSALSGAVRISPGGVGAALGEGAGKACVQWSGNGHWYQLFEVNLNWTDAKAAAEGLGGYLVTVTSAEEADFLRPGLIKTALEHGRGYTWIGLYQDPVTGPPKANWRWVTGEPLTYTNWSAREPNEFSPGEDYGEMMGEAESWNDVTSEGGVMGGGHLHNAIVEWNGPVLAPGSEGSLPLIFDGRGGWNRSGAGDLVEARHPGGTDVLFADGHVGHVGAGQLSTLTWEPAANVAASQEAASEGDTGEEGPAQPAGNTVGRPGSWKPIPILIGKSQDDVLKALGPPADTYQETPAGADLAMGLPHPYNLAWTYGNVGAVGGELLVVGIDYDIRQAWRLEYKPAAGTIIRDIVPKGETTRNPSYRLVLLGHEGQFVLGWTLERIADTGVRTGVLEVIGKLPTPCCVEERHFDQQAGVYRTTYRVADDLVRAALDAEVINYVQERTRPLNPWEDRLTFGGHESLRRWGSKVVNDRGWDIIYGD